MVERIYNWTPEGSELNKADGLNPIVIPYDRDTFDKVVVNYISKTDNDKHCYIRESKKCYCTTILSFDIEVSSVMINDNKFGIPYIWQLAVQDYVFYGRTFSDIVDVFQDLSKIFNTSEDRHLIVWVHNLSYEFQFIKKYFKWKEVFALDDRRPLYATTESGIEFRCSYMLSGMSLNELGEKGIHKGKVKKMIGDLDYDLVRHEKTPLTDTELQYCINDVLVVVEYITEQVNEIYGNIVNVPYTKTGAVRKYVRSKTIENEDNNVKMAYRRLIEKLTLSEDEYYICKRAFMGGFTHANPLYSGKVLHNVDSIDISSSYPTVLCTEEFPMSKGVLITKEDEYLGEDDIEELSKDRLLIFDCLIDDLESKEPYEHILQDAKCFDRCNVVVDNNRVVSAKRLTTTMTNVDLEMFKLYYDYGNILFYNVWCYKKAYLPKHLIKSILDLYVDKTKLKDVDGKVLEYMLKKSNLNSVYGMTVMDIIREILEYRNDMIIDVSDYMTRDDWMKRKSKMIEDYNKNKNRFLFYPWGIFCTAYARRRLLTMVHKMGSDHIYSDTDSDKFINYDKHIKDIEEENHLMDLKINDVCEAYGLDKSLFYPKDIKGEEHPLGYWDLETRKSGSYSRFKAIGSKRYLVELIDQKTGRSTIKLTCSGVNKKKGVEYLCRDGKDPFEEFDDGLSIPKEYTGKLTPTYIDDEVVVKVRDYKGITDICKVKSGVYLEKSEFSLSIEAGYKRFLLSEANIQYFKRLCM